MQKNLLVLFQFDYISHIAVWRLTNLCQGFYTDLPIEGLYIIIIAVVV